METRHAAVDKFLRRTVLVSEDQIKDNLWPADWVMLRSVVTQSTRAIVLMERQDMLHPLLDKTQLCADCLPSLKVRLLRRRWRLTKTQLGCHVVLSPTIFRWNENRRQSKHTRHVGNVESGNRTLLWITNQSGRLPCFQAYISHRRLAFHWRMNGRTGTACVRCDT